MIFFSADTHMGHTNVIKYARRPFKHIDEMNEVIIKNWNSVVSKDDQVYFLGDFAFAKPEKAISFLTRMNGEKFLIQGNHDRELVENEQFCNQFTWVKQLHTIEVPDTSHPKNVRPVVLCHYAMRTWDRSHYGAYQLYGHSHNSLEDLKTHLSIDVGVDAHNFYPISFDRVTEIMKSKTWKSNKGRKDENEEEY
jgi:calcineurin-like phosphoesterase family protein